MIGMLTLQLKSISEAALSTGALIIGHRASISGSHGTQRKKFLAPNGLRCLVICTRQNIHLFLSLLCKSLHASATSSQAAFVFSCASKMRGVFQVDELGEQLPHR